MSSKIYRKAQFEEVEMRSAESFGVTPDSEPWSGASGLSASVLIHRL